jgi:hypothetical protein
VPSGLVVPEKRESEEALTASAATASTAKTTDLQFRAQQTKNKRGTKVNN